MAKKGTAKKVSTKSSEKISFEDALAKLEQAVNRLEEGNIGLAEAIAEYEQGVKHLKHCYQLLESAERKIELLTGLDADGNPTTQAFEHAASSASETPVQSGRAKKRGARSRRTAQGGAADAQDGDVDAPPSLF